MSNVTPERLVKPASALEAGDWLAENEVAEVMWVTPYTDAAGAAMVMAVSHHPDRAPETERFRAAEQVSLATEAEITAGRRYGHRRAVADLLHNLADMIIARDLPLGERPIDVTFHAADAGVVKQAAKLLGVDVRIDSAGRHAAHYPPVDEYGMARGPVDAEWFVYGEKPHEKSEVSKPQALEAVTQ